MSRVVKEKKINLSVVLDSDQILILIRKTHVIYKYIRARTHARSLTCFYTQLHSASFLSTQKPIKVELIEVKLKSQQTVYVYIVFVLTRDKRRVNCTSETKKTLLNMFT